MSHTGLVIQNTLIASSTTANALAVGDIINGPGIPIDSLVIGINYAGNGTWEIIIDQVFVEGDVYATGNHIPYLDPNAPVPGPLDYGLVQFPTEIFVTSTTPPLPTVTYKEDVKGWVSFKSFIPENAISMANDYYTFKNGELWRHHDEIVNRNTFYGNYTDTTFNVILNQASGSVKSFNTLNYEGSQSRVTINVKDDQYYNLVSKQGWWVDNMFTNKETGSIEEFIEKEGKWFNYIKGNPVLHEENTVNILVNPDGSSSWDQASFAIQGLGTFVDTSNYSFPGCMDVNANNFVANANVNTYCKYTGCMDSNASNYGMLEIVGIHIDNYTWQDTNGTVYNPTITDLSSPCGNCCNIDIYGCTDATANNYDASATIDDSSCTYNVLGCMDATACNYDALANVDDGTCILPDGCTDVTQYNYDPLATCDDGSCTPIILGCTDPTATNQDILANTDDGSCIYPIYGCTDPLYLNYDSTATVDDGSCSILIVTGCTDILGCNYNSLATVDDGSCTYAVTNADCNGNCLSGFVLNSNGICVDCTYGCMDATASNYDAGATCDDGSCTYCNAFTLDTSLNPPIINSTTLAGLPYGVVDGTPIDSAGNSVAGTYTWEWYEQSTPSTIIFPGQSLPIGITLAYPIPGGTFTGDSGTYVGVATDAFGCTGTGSITIIAGSTDPNAGNYDPNANFDDGSSLYTLVCQACININPNGIYAADLASPGCCDATQSNYDANATCSDGSCIPFTYGCTGVGAMNYNSNATDDDGSCLYPGCTDPAADNYDATANFDDGSCIYGGCPVPTVYGCNDPTASNYDTLANCDDGSCIPYVYGCMDPLALNYSSTVNTDDGSCLYGVFGCTDPLATNYDPAATIDNGTCTY